MQLPYRGLAIYANHGEQEIVMDAGTLRLISGSASTRFVELVLEWAQIHQADLKRALSTAQTRRAPCTAAPFV